MNIIQEFESNEEYIGGERLYRARNIMKIFGYTKWERFEGAIKRAIENIKDENLIKKNFFPVEVKSTGGRPGRDYLLTKGACYYVIKNCDFRKEEVLTLHDYLKQTYLNSKIKKEILLKNNSYNYSSYIKVYLVMFWVFSLLIITFLSFNYIKERFTRNNIIQEQKELSIIENIKKNEILVSSGAEKEEIISEISNNNSGTTSNDELWSKLDKYIKKGGGEKFISYNNNPRTEFTKTLSGTKLIESYFLFGNNALYKDSCSLLSKKYCNALSKDLTSFQNTWTTTSSGYELVDVYEKESGIYCVKTKSILKNDTSNNPLIQTFSYKTINQDGIEYINGRFCEKIEKNGKNIPCPHELKNYYCLQ